MLCFKMEYLSGSLIGGASLRASGLAFEPDSDGAEDRFLKAAREAISEMDFVDIGFGFQGSPDSLWLSVTSNIDDLLVFDYETDCQKM